jgi:uncharacterized damage-inducible protein DinB
MNINDIKTLYEYNEWANSKFVQVIKNLSEEQFTSEIKSSFSSVRDTLGHIVCAEWIWLRRWLGESPVSMPAWLDKPILIILTYKLSEIETERNKFISGLSDESLQKIISYRNTKGEATKKILKNLFQHVVNHSSYHRGQLATLLRQLGTVPPATDFVLFIGEN